MTDILKFPKTPSANSKPARAGATGHLLGAASVYPYADFLRSAADDDCIEFLAGGKIRAAKRPQVSPINMDQDPYQLHSPLDWSNQELASLYRAQRLLQLAGIRVETDRGVSDEGEPWFVFIDESEKVIAHFCRIAGEYLLDSVAQKSSIVGASLDDLVTGFAERSQPVAMSPSSKSLGGRTTSDKVQRFHLAKQAKVRMHPAAALAALLWSIYILSDELSLPRGYVEYSDAAGTDPQPDAALATINQKQINLTGNPLQLDHPEFGSSTDQKASDDRESALSTVSISGQVAGNSIAKAMGLGLTSIAMSYGIHLLTQINSPLAEVVTAALGISTELPVEIEMTLTELARELTADRQFEKTEKAEIIAKPTAVEEAPSSAQPEMIQKADLVLQDAPDDLLIPMMLSEEILASFTDFPISDEGATINHAADVPIAAEYGEKISEENEESEAQELYEEVLTREASSDQSKIDLSEILSDFSEASAQVNLAARSALSGSWEKFGGAASELDTVAASEIDTFDGNGDTSQGALYLQFNDAAYDFIVWLMLKGDVTTRSDNESEIILTDTDALESSSGELYTLSWSFEDGSVLSTVGLRDDFEAFGFIS
ncbi:MAG: hypothetical protein OXC63_05305 [Aestuariivita sp.]|nr:hypothetical protein [Aestuariivita sp.]MCY4347583.1 hypothetical protein [Aestuariivita sp.]